MTEVKVLIPAVMSSSTNGEREVEIDGKTVIEVIDELAKIAIDIGVKKELNLNFFMKSFSEI